MKISCNMAEDLLPLYLDGTCSQDSRAALEAHLEECERCREILRRMQSPVPVPEPQDRKQEVLTYAKKVKKHRLRNVLLFLCVILVSVLVLTVVCLACEDMLRTADPTIHQVEDGVWNLTSNPLETTAEAADQYILFTNNTKVEVTVDTGTSGQVLLYNAEYPDQYILQGTVTPENCVVTFSYLTSGARYFVSCQGLDGATVTITDGRIINFWYSLGNVLENLVQFFAH